MFHKADLMQKIMKWSIARKLILIKDIQAANLTIILTNLFLVVIKLTLL